MELKEFKVIHSSIYPTSSCMYWSRNGEALKLSTGMLKKPWISFWWRSMVIRWVRPTKTQTHFLVAPCILQMLCLLQSYIVKGCSLLPHTSFTHHGGNKLGDDRAPLPHLTLLAVGKVGEHTSDASSARCPACIHHDQHLHDGGVHIPESVETWGGVNFLF